MSEARRIKERKYIYMHAVAGHRSVPRHPVRSNSRVADIIRIGSRRDQV
jgi:hypothetical protein